ncbi:tRNA-dihydrouridine synthase [Candidatus Woesebacteria bacterium]|nr:tRNA-dihydrouridine synthase [Candidatus Woesebacteria bacterium]
MEIQQNNKGTGFWQQLRLPILGLSPMDGVSDAPFRFIQQKYGQPSVTYTEFSSVEGICHGSSTFQKEFLFDQTQRPVLAQIFGTDPNCFYQSTILCCELGFDGIDINMGCPAKNVSNRGAGAGLIRTPKLAQQIISAVQKGVKDWSEGATIEDCPDIIEESKVVVRKRKSDLHNQERRLLPVSVKTRIGYDSAIISEWIPVLLEMEPAAIALHGRTLKQQYGGNANWECIAEAAQLANPTQTLLLGNGDVHTKQDAVMKASTYGVDGVLIGRASFGNPFIFLDEPPTSPSIAQIALEHAQLYEHTFNKLEKYAFLPMRKHLGWYIRGMDKASEIRARLFATNTAGEVEFILREYQLL